jgi:hypothetical protein
MRAAYVTELGAADAIRVGELPVPAAGPTDVLVRVEVVAVNPVDTMVRSGAYPTPTPFPFVIGRDLVGTVAVAAPGAAGFAPGDRVWCNSLGHGGRQGSFAEYAVVLVFADLRGANLSGAKLQADMTKAELDGANLDGADFTGANLNGVDFSQARHLDRAIGLDRARFYKPPTPKDAAAGPGQQQDQPCLERSDWWNLPKVPAAAQAGG